MCFEFGIRCGGYLHIMPRPQKIGFISLILNAETLASFIGRLASFLRMRK